MRTLTLIPLLAFSTVAACSNATAAYGQEEVILLEVAPDRVPCVGEMRDMCLQVRSPGEDEWRLFYDPIQGFQHEEGVQYTLEVGRRRVLNPPADGSAYVYRLIRIITQERVGDLIPDLAG